MLIRRVRQEGAFGTGVGIDSRFGGQGAKRDKSGGERKNEGSCAKLFHSLSGGYRILLIVGTRFALRNPSPNYQQLQPHMLFACKEIRDKTCQIESNSAHKSLN